MNHRNIINIVEGVDWSSHWCDSTSICLITNFCDLQLLSSDSRAHIRVHTQTQTETQNKAYGALAISAAL